MGWSATSASRAGARYWRNMHRPLRRSSGRTASTAMSSRRSGASSRTTARCAATVPWSAPRRRSPASAAAAISFAKVLSALEILQRGDVKPERLVGSWAGAFGPTQFMPTTFKRYAVDFDGDGRRDVVDSIADMIASTANNLKTDGWASGEGWGYEVALPPNFDFLLARPFAADDAAPMAGARRRPRRRPGVPASFRSRLSAGAGRGARPGVPDAAEFQRHHEIQPGGSLRARHGHFSDRLRGGGPLLAGLAARGASAHGRRALRACSSSSASAASTSASPMAASGRAPASPSATFRSRTGEFPTGSRRATCSTVCASRDRAILRHLRRRPAKRCSHPQVDIFWVVWGLIQRASSTAGMSRR